MPDFASSLTRTVARQYDLFQSSLELLQKDRKFLNYGYTVSGKETYEDRQQQLCIEVFQAAEIGKGDVIIDSRLRERRTGLPPVECVRVRAPDWLQHLRTTGSLRERAG